MANEDIRMLVQAIGDYFKYVIDGKNGAVVDDKIIRHGFTLILDCGLWISDFKCTTCLIFQSAIRN